MNVTKEKLEEIFKVYEDKKSNNPNTIKTADVGTCPLTQPNSSGLPVSSPLRRKSSNWRKESTP